jgi:hypothetical protein
VPQDTLKESIDRPCQQVINDPNRGRLAFHARNIIRHPLQFLRVSAPILTAHHPSCPEYEGHVFTFRNRTWCIGCTFSSIGFFSTAVLFFIIWYYDIPLLNTFFLFWGGVAGTVVSLLASVFQLTENKKVKALSKSLLGIAFAAVSWAILLNDGDLWNNIASKVVLILGLYLVVITLMTVRRTLEISQTCETCKYRMRWSKCPGFTNLVCRLIEEGFIQPKDSE